MLCFCIVYSLAKIVLDAIGVGGVVVETYSGIGVVAALYVDSNVHLCLSHLEKEHSLICFSSRVVEVFIVSVFRVEGET